MPFDFHYEDEADDDPSRPHQRESETAFDILPIVLLEEAMSQEQVDSVKAEGGFCLVVQTPSAEWVAPMAATLRRLADWDLEYTKTAPSRSRLTSDDDIVTRVSRRLSSGRRVFGIAPTMELLPSVMLDSADLVVRLDRPSAKAVARAIEMVTGSRPIALDEEDIGGIGFDQLAACIRMGTTAQECVDRLVRIAKARKTTDATVADVPELDELHGYGAAGVWAKQLVSDLTAWRAGSLDFSDLESSVLLVSEPGMGKTTLARSLARTTGLPLIATSVAQWFTGSSGYLDGVLKRIDEVFASARAVAPAILLLDEADILPDRAQLEGKNRDFWAAVIGHVLTILDGAATGLTKNLIIVAATNYEHLLDPALLRPGRISKTIRIGRPDQNALLGILRQHLGRDLVDIDLSPAARLAIGSSGADVAGYVKSARAKARVDNRSLTLPDLMDAIAPAQDRSAETNRRIAVHEAGHAVVANAVGFAQVEWISILTRGVTEGSTKFGGSGDFQTRLDIEKFVVQALGGRAAEEVVFGDGGTGSGGHAISDLALATRKLGLIHLSLGLGDSLLYQGDEADVPRLLLLDRGLAAKVEAEMQVFYQRARELVIEHRHLLDDVTAELVAHLQVTGARFAELCKARSNLPLEPKSEIEGPASEFPAGGAIRHGAGKP